MPDDVLQAAEGEWASKDHPVFQLVLPPVDAFLDEQLRLAGNPKVSFDNFWDIYQHVLAMAQDALPAWPEVVAILEENGAVHDGGEEQGMPLIPHAQVAEFGVGGIPPLVRISGEPALMISTGVGVYAASISQPKWPHGDGLGHSATHLSSTFLLGAFSCPYTTTLWSTTPPPPISYEPRAVELRHSSLYPSFVGASKRLPTLRYPAIPRWSLSATICALHCHIVLCHSSGPLTCATPT